MASIGGRAFSIDSVVRGYHIYKEIWDADIGSELPCYQESSNSEDRYAVALMDDEHVVGHVPRTISFICHLFLIHSGVILCRVTGPMQYSRDLVQGGAEVPCQYQFYSENEECLKVVQGLLESASYTTIAFSNIEKFQAMKNALNPVNSTSSTCINGESIVKEEKVESKPKDVCSSMENQVIHIKTEKPDVKRRKIDTSASSKGKKEWLRMGGIKLRMEDRDSILAGEQLDDMVINVAQRLLKSQYPKIKGLCSTLLQDRKRRTVFEQNMVQIVHSRGNHWITATSATVKVANQVNVYDSLYDDIDEGTCNIISNVFGTSAVPCSVKIHKQSGVDDCGLFAIANATSICNGQDPAVMKFDQSLMRLHLAQCIDKKMMTSFPTLL